MYDLRIQIGAPIVGGACILGVFTGAAYMLNSPLTLGGAATFGAAFVLIQAPTYWLGRKLTKVSSLAGDGFVYAISCIVSTFFTQKLVSAFGVAVSLKTSLALTATVLCGLSAIAIIAYFALNKSRAISSEMIGPGLSGLN